ncbi:pentapeptide repeat-containing protein [Glycomyces sp. NPDC049804]|uniref:pentapeptide repeat-containing protein n=1 Tax=Glycomyces sp. NPDC049804 TaxID=3154363 RepID=UPI00344326AE
MVDKDNDARTRWWPWIVVALVAIMGGWLLAWLLVLPMAGSNPDAQVNAVQATFTIAFGLGGLVGLALIARRQWHQERAHRLQERIHEHDRFDARERRITEQYIKAIEQLGHEKTPVRLGGLYALDRLGRDHPEHRQAIAEVWCAYLRRRYLPPSDLVDATVGEVSPRDIGVQEPSTSDQDAYDEAEVRMTAQRLLASHLKDPRPHDQRDGGLPAECRQYWRLDRLDLNGATLINADFSGCTLPPVDAYRALFINRTSFEFTHFTSDARFDDARFRGEAWFSITRFAGDARFDRAHFADIAWFPEAQFADFTRFAEARFDDDAAFFDARFEVNVDFDKAHFEGEALFMRAVFVRNGGFESTCFADGATFSSARFEGLAAFGASKFGSSAQFDQAHFARNARFTQAGFADSAWFKNAHFGDDAWFLGARFDGRAEFIGIELEPGVNAEMDGAVTSRIKFESPGPGSSHKWPPGWVHRDAEDGTWPLTWVQNSAMQESPSGGFRRA